MPPPAGYAYLGKDGSRRAFAKWTDEVNLGVHAQKCVREQHGIVTCAGLETRACDPCSCIMGQPWRHRKYPSLWAIHAFLKLFPKGPIDIQSIEKPNTF